MSVQHLGQDTSGCAVIGQFPIPSFLSYPILNLSTTKASTSVRTVPSGRNGGMERKPQVRLVPARRGYGIVLTFNVAKHRTVITAGT